VLTEQRGQGQTLDWREPVRVQAPEQRALMGVQTMARRALNLALTEARRNQTPPPPPPPQGQMQRLPKEL